MTSSGPHPHGGDRVAAALQAHGVTLMFTLCGGHISPILTASDERREQQQQHRQRKHFYVFDE